MAPARMAHNGNAEVVRQCIGLDQAQSFRTALLHFVCFRQSCVGQKQ